MNKQHKGDRVLNLYLRLMNGEVIGKWNYALEEHVTPRTFERDIQTIRNCLSDAFSSEEIIFDRKRNGYRILSYSPKEKLTLVEGYVLLRSMFTHGAMRSDEAAGLMESVLALLEPADRLVLKPLMQPVLSEYNSSHGKALMKMIQDLLLMISKQQKMTLCYAAENSIVTINVLPLELICGEKAFFLVGAEADSEFPVCALFDVSQIHSFIPLPSYYIADSSLKKAWASVKDGCLENGEENYIWRRK